MAKNIYIGRSIHDIYYLFSAKWAWHRSIGPRYGRSVVNCVIPPEFVKRLSSDTTDSLKKGEFYRILSVDIVFIRQ